VNIKSLFTYAHTFTLFPAFAVCVLIGFKEKYKHFRTPLSNLMIAVLRLWVKAKEEECIRNSAFRIHPIFQRLFYLLAWGLHFNTGIFYYFKFHLVLMRRRRHNAET